MIGSSREERPATPRSAGERGLVLRRAGREGVRGPGVGEQVAESDMVVHPNKKKHLTNMRASGSDMAIKLTPPRPSLSSRRSSGSTTTSSSR